MQKLGAKIEPPVGLSAINLTFGNISDYIILNAEGSMALNPAFEGKYITTFNLPFPIPLAWDKQTLAASLRCHYLLREHFLAVFNQIIANGLQDKVQAFGGCFQFRRKRQGRGLSTHSWGIAVDLNPETNRQGTSGNMDMGIVKIFKDIGFVWGGDWTGRRRDPMHFQFCRGY